MNYDFRSQELKFLNSRGLIKQITHSKELDEKFLNNQKITFYIGFDCTAKSLHIGHLIPLMITKYLLKFGHKAIIILGTTTAKIGDPSGKSQTRKILTEEEIGQNFLSMSNIIKNFLIRDGIDDNKILFLENNWLEGFTLVKFLRDFGSLFSVNRMVSMETFKNRLENGENLSFLEFTYSLFQSYDFFHLNKEFDCILQIGGSDQWGNIISGIDFGSKLLPNKEFFGMTCNLLLNSSGEKMGKTVNGAVWLDSSLFSPFEYWQYFRNIDDSDIKNIFNILSDFSNDEIDEILKINNINESKIILATNLTKICHGEENANLAKKESIKKFASTGNILDNDIEPDFYINLQANKSIILDKNKEYLFEKNNINYFDLVKFIMKDESNSEVRKLFSQNAIKINNNLILEYMNEIDFNSNIFHKNLKFVLNIGKKKKYVFSIII